MNRRLLVALGLAGAALAATAAALVRYAHEFQPDSGDADRGMVLMGSVWIATGLVAWSAAPRTASDC